MNRKEQLIADSLGDGEGVAFARQAAALARRRHTAKQAGVAGGLAVAGLAAVLLATRPSPAVQTPAVPPGPQVEIISDQELMTQLKGQPVLFLKEDNRITGVVFLTAPNTGTKL